MTGHEINVEDVEPISRTYQYKKVMKPMLERKRRARMNKSLEELKALIAVNLHKDGESITKLEKADVLELTVKYLQSLKRRNSLAIPAQIESQKKFCAGFSHCAKEVQHFLNAVPGVDMRLSSKLLQHLNGTIGHLNRTNPHRPQPVFSHSPVYTPPASPEMKTRHSQNSPGITPAPQQNETTNTPLSYTSIKKEPHSDTSPNQNDNVDTDMDLWKPYL